MIGHQLWSTRFGRADLADTTITLNGATFRVVGVAPAGFRGALLAEAPDVWIPIHAWPLIATANERSLQLERRGWGWITLIARLRPEASPRQAEDEINAIARQDSSLSSSSTPPRLETASLAAAAGGRQHDDVSRFLMLLAGIVGFALLMACANVANLMLVRISGRRRELAIRQALGAAPSRIVRLLLAEGLLLAAVSSVIALLATAWAMDLFRGILLPGGIRLDQLDVRFDGRLMSVALGLATATGIVFSLMPALQAARIHVVDALKETPSRFRSRLSARQVLVAVQVAVCLLLLAGAALFLRSVRATLRSNVGFDINHVATAGVAPQLQRYDGPRTQRLFAAARARVLADPRVRGASWAALLPLTGDRMRETVTVEGYDRPANDSRAVRFNGRSDTDAVSAWFIVRGDGDTAALLPAVQDALTAAAPDLPVVEPGLLRDRLADLLMPQRFAGTLLSLFGIAATVLAGVGIYGVTAFSVARRTREIGIRVALGAAGADIVRLIVTGVLRPIGAGAVAGLVAAAIAAQLIARFLQGISPLDPVAFGLTALALLLIAVAATWMPLHRALAVDPSVALRAD